MNIKKQFKDGLITNNPVLVQLLGMCSTMAITTMFFNGIGMTHSQTMLKVIIPQVMRNILPSVSNEFVINIKDTSVLNVIGVTELYYFAGIIKRQSFETFQTYLVVCVIYFILTFTVTRLLRWVERKLDGNDSYVIFGSQSDSAAEIRISREA